MRPSKAPEGAASSFRVAFFTDSFAPMLDGVAQVTDTLARALLADGHEVTVFTVQTPGTPRAETRADGVRLRRFRSVSAPGYPEYRIAVDPFLAVNPSDEPFDIIHIHTPGFVGLAGLWHARRSGVPTVGTYHTHLSEMLKRVGRHSASRSFFRAWGRFAVDLCRACDAATAPSEVARAALTPPGASPLAQQPRVIPNGIDPAFLRPHPDTTGWGARTGLSPGTSLVTFLGRLTTEKGVFRFLDALERMAARPEWTGAIGGQGPQAPMIRERLATSGSMAQRIRFLGPVSETDKPVLLAQSRVFVLPSIGDTSSIALLEAMACGAACVVTNRGGPAEIARRAAAGLLVDPEEPAQIAAAIERFLEDADLRIAHIARGREWVAAHASAAQMATEFTKCYQSLIPPRATLRSRTS